MLVQETFLADNPVDQQDTKHHDEGDTGEAAEAEIEAGKKQRHMLAAYAHDLGLAFQIVDDLLDLEGDTEEMGKRTGKDDQAGKATFVSLLGAERAREQANILTEQAIKHLEIFADKGKLLRDLAEYVIKRRK